MAKIYKQVLLKGRTFPYDHQTVKTEVDGKVAYKEVSVPKEDGKLPEIFVVETPEGWDGFVCFKSNWNTQEAFGLLWKNVED